MSAASRLLRPMCRRHWPALAGAGASSVLVAVADLAKPFPVKLVIDNLLLDREGSFELTAADYRMLAGIALLVMAIAVTDAIASYYADVLLTRAGERITHDLRVRVYAHLQRLSLAFHNRRQKGDLVARVTSDVSAAGTLFSDSLGALIQSALLLVGMIVVSFLLDPVLAAVIFALTPVLGLLAIRYQRRIKAIARTQRSQEGEIASLATEALAAMHAVKAFGTERFEHERLKERSEKRRELGVKAARLEGRLGGLIDVLGAVASAVVIVVGVLRVAAGALTPGDLVVFASYTKRSYKPLREIARQAARAARATARVDRIAELLATDEALPEPHGGFCDGRAAGVLELERVSFAYDAERPALKHVSLRIAAGSRVAIVGRSGAGKSTAAALVARFYDPVSGRVLIDGRDARDCSLDWLRAQVGLVLQDTLLFSGTVSENIGYGTSATRDEVVRAAKAAAAHDFICELPQGYDTELGPSAVALSGGQRQRIGVARTLLRDPSILVLDEPTTGLDRESEAQVLAGLGALMRGRTTLIITHSLSLARTAESVIVIDDGKVVEEGAPDDLLARPGAFQHLAAERRLLEDDAPTDAAQERESPTPPLRSDRSPPRSRAAVGLRAALLRCAALGLRAAPTDPALPQMPRLLDAEAMEPVLRRSLGRPAIVSAVRVAYLRYKPETNLRVHYEVEVDDRLHDAVAMIAVGPKLARRSRKPEHVAIAATVNGRSPAAFPLVYDAETESLIQWLPLDLSLPGLVEPPALLRGRLRAAGLQLAVSDAEPRRLAYKPQRRAVLGLERHVLKAYASPWAYERAVARLQMVSTGALGVASAGLEAALPDLRVTVQPFLEGTVASGAPGVAGQAGTAIRSLHEVPAEGLPPALPAWQLQRAVGVADVLARVAPGVSTQLERLTPKLARRAPSPGGLVTSHGDFHPGQLLVQPGGELAVVDLDRMCTAPAAYDLATYAASAVDGGDLDAARASLQALLEGYGSRPAGLDWYLSIGILQRAVFSFRRLDADWLERVEALVASADTALGGATAA